MNRAVQAQLRGRNPITACLAVSLSFAGKIRCRSTLAYKHLLGGEFICRDCHSSHVPRVCLDLWEFTSEHCDFPSFNTDSDVLCSRCQTSISIYKRVRDCPECFNKVIQHINGELPREAVLGYIQGSTSPAA